MADPEKTGSTPAQESLAPVGPGKPIEVPLVISISGGSGSTPPQENARRKLLEIPVLLTIGGLIIGAGTFGATFGFTVGRAVSTENEQGYREDKADLEKKLAQAEKDRDLAQQAQATLTEKLLRPYGQTAAGTTGGENGVAQNAVDAQILVGETVTMFKGQLFVSVVSVEAIPAAPQFVASVTFGSPGKDNASMKGRPGDVTTYNGFEIRITSVDAASATVRVQRLPAAIQQQP